MTEIKAITCSNCGTALTREDEYRENMFECSFCKAISCVPVSSVPVKVVYREPKEPEEKWTLERHIATLQDAVKGLLNK